MPQVRFLRVYWVRWRARVTSRHSPGSGRHVRVSFLMGAPPSSTGRHDTVTVVGVDPRECRRAASGGTEGGKRNNIVLNETRKIKNDIVNG